MAITDTLSYTTATQAANESFSTLRMAGYGEVLRGVSQGCSNKIVADHLKIAEDTVKGHMKSIMAKLQANDRTHAVLIAMKRGFLDG